MTNIYYNVETADKKYAALSGDKRYLPVGDNCFSEKIDKNKKIIKKPLLFHQC